jgi:hypothetical protein
VTVKAYQVKKNSILKQEDMSNSRNKCRDSGKQNIELTALLLALNVLCAGSSNSFSDFSEIFVSSLINNVLRVLAFFVEPLYNFVWSGCTRA